MKYLFPVVGSKIFAQMGKMSFADCVACGVKSRIKQYFYLNLKDRNRIIELEDKMPLYRIIK
jgi:uncharacterized protein (DUF2344 family)